MSVSPSTGALRDAFAALRADLIQDDGPRISTMRNYRFAILQYSPALEFQLRAEVQKLGGELIATDGSFSPSISRSCCWTGSEMQAPIGFGG